MTTVREMDSRLQETLADGRRLLGKMKRKHAELSLLRQSLPKDKTAERAELLELIGMCQEYQAKLKAEMTQAHDIANKIEGRLLWKNAVHAIWGDDGLEKVYAHMREQEAERSKLYQDLQVPD